DLPAIRCDRLNPTRAAAPALAVQRGRGGPAQGRRWAGFQSIRHRRRAVGGVAAARRDRARPRAFAVAVHPDLYRPGRADAHPQRLLLPRAYRGVWPGASASPRAHASGPEGGPAAPDEGNTRESLPNRSEERRVG